MAASEPTTRYLIRGGRVYDHDGDVHQPATADLLISDGKIERIAPRIADFDGEIIEAAGKLIVPGFVNAHYHSHDALLKGMFEEMPFDIWARSYQRGELRTALAPRIAHPHADRRRRDAAQRHHHGAGFPDRVPGRRGGRRHRAVGL